MIVVRARSVARAHPCDTTNLLQFAVFLPTLAPLQIFFYQKLRTEILEPEYSSLKKPFPTTAARTYLALKTSVMMRLALSRYARSHVLYTVRTKTTDQ
jgi:hypothetical protein